MTASTRRTLLLAGLALLVAAGCEEQPEPYDGPPVGLIDDSILLPYPSIHLMSADDTSATGYRVAIPADLLPVPDGGSPLPVERFDRHDGFSVANTSVVLLPDADIDPATLPTVHDLAASLDAGASVQIVDLTAGARVPCFAELDAHPDTTGPADRVLLIRPMQAIPGGHHVAVALTTALEDLGGATIPSPERFAALRDGGDVHPGLASYADHYDALLDDLAGLGLERSDVVLAWDYWTATEEVTHRAFDAVVEATRASLPSDASFDPAVTIDWISDSDEGYELNEHLWRRAQGSFELASFLGEDGMFTLDEDGLPVPQGSDDVYFMGIVPASLHDAPAGSAPVLVFGHGIFAAPYNYIGDEDDPNSMLALADRLGFIVIGSKWRGLTGSDMPDAVQVANDFGQFPLITDKLIQGVANQMALPRLVRTTFADEAWLQASGGGSLVDPDRVYYMGISLGGIEGATLMANTEEIEYGVLHVGGGIWSTMLERSSNWPPFETWLTDAVPSPVDRQVLYAVSQLLWDPVDPITHAHHLADRSLLWQESMGDEQVPNMTTEAVVRSAGVPMVVPSIESPYGIETVEAPLGPGSVALMQFDPQLGRPVDANRPAAVTGAHHYIRGTDEVHEQIEAFFADGSEGTIIHPCGDQPCVFEGTPE